MNIRRLFLFVAACAITTISFAQSILWSKVETASVSPYTDTRKNLLPQNFSVFKLNKPEAERLQRQALRGGIPQIPVNASAPFDLPLPDGKVITTTLVDAPVLSEELQKAYPGIKTYQLINPKNKNVVARLTISDLGVSGLIFTDKGTAYISPLGSEYPGVHMVYYIKDLKTTNPVDCGVKEDLSNLRQQGIQAGDGNKRTYRLAVAATGEYTTWAGSQANALTYITSTVNDVIAIYERDNTISFTLVTNNSILFTNAATDPYPTVSFPNSTILSDNQTTVDANIGSANYDLGFVFNNGWNGGLAAVGVVCNNSSKAQGSGGINFGTGANATAGPQGPIFSGTVAHEIGHLFSATHTFAANNGSCSGNTTAATAYEPGGGSTLMAYAGACTGNSYQNNTDLYFHAGSIAQIQSYAIGSATCTTPVVTSNHQPTVTVPSATYTIPVSTPFTLTSTGADADGNTLYYTWEQMDAGFVTSSPPASTNTTGPNFRSYFPSLSSSRTFPGINDIIAGNSPTYEVLSSVTRTMNFRVTARDEASGGGATGEANVAVTTNASTGPFIVTSQSSAATWAANGSNTAIITWNVANTTAAPVSCSAVDILFSIDGGLTYPYTLASNIPNSGTQTITIPSLPTSIGRVKVQSRGNIFFNINSADITITSSCSAEGTTFTPSASVSAPAGSSSLHLSLSPQYGTVVSPSGTLVSSDPASTLVVVDSTTHGPESFSNVFLYDTYTFTVNVAGTYTLTIAGTFPTMINLYAQSFNPSSPATNFITSNGTYRDVTATVAISNSISASLTPGRYYTLAVGTFSATQPALPASYSVSVTAPSGGNLYTGAPNPGASFNYTYVIVDNATGDIKAFDPGSDLSNSSNYPADTYTVYGLSYSNSVSLSTLNSYVGGLFTTFYNDLLYNSSICGNLSKDLLTATVTATLPAQLLPLNAYKNGNTVLLNWATASEQNNNYFEIQRSADGLSFSDILGKVASAGNSTVKTNYSFTDATPGSSWNYYRIKQVDLDGKSTFTNIAKVNFAAKNASSAIIYPNPAKSILNVDYYTENAGQVKWTIIDGRGSVVRESSFAAQSGRNTQQLNVSGLASGTYMLRTVSNNEVLVSKFVKE